MKPGRHAVFNLSPGEDNVRQLILTTILAIGTATAWSSTSSAQYLHCVAGYGCAPATQASYNACFQLGLARGLTVTVGDKRNLDFFILQCLVGRIPR
jgi:hypothetical protein